MRAISFATLTVGFFLLACTGTGTDADKDEGTDGDCSDNKWFRDQDGDGFGNPKKSERGCEAPSGYVKDDSDCDDEDARANPDEKEVCDGVDADENCNGVADEDDDTVVLTKWYADTDNDDYGDPNSMVEACDQPDGHVENAEDCDDDDRRINPEGNEVCDGGSDEDCDGLIDAEDDTMDPDIVPTWYRDADNDGYGATSPTKEQCEQPSGYADNNDDCDDSDKDTNPGETEVCGDGADNNCNNSADGCGLEGEIPATDGTRITGPSGAGFGNAVTAVPDVDGDGDAEVAVGCPYASSDGIVYFFEGPLTSDVTYTSADTTFTGESAGDSFGIALASGDYDKNGEGDLIVGDSTYDYSTSYTETGRVYFFSGPFSSSEGAGSANTIWTNNSKDNDYLGASIAVGDWNNNGYDDVFALASGSDTVIGELNIGTGSRDAYAINEWEGAGIAEVSASASGGDLDGDGNHELVVSDSTVSSSRGAVYVLAGDTFSGSVTLSSYYDATVSGGNSGDAIGYSLSVDGDLDADGYDDLVIGAPEATSGSSRGVAYVCFGPVTTKAAGSCDVLVKGSNTYERFSFAVDIMGDENADGDDDLIVGAPSAAGAAGGYSGAAYLFRGPLSAGSITASAADAVIEGTVRNGYLGYAAVGAGDVNDDGNDDILLGAPSSDSTSGNAWLIFGGAY